MSLKRQGSGVGHVAPNTVNVTRKVFSPPRSLDRQQWWVDSAKHYALPTGVNPRVPVICWNPFALASTMFGSVTPRCHFDLLDDWSVHYAFKNLWPDVNRAYAKAFDVAQTVTANSESTLELAHKHGRSDAVLILNGCDPERFRTTSRAEGPTTVGYVGKIGKRLNLDLILDVSRTFPEVKFVFAGPILDSEYRKPLSSAENITLLGDVHYERVPELLETFDVGWVPHKTGEGEVGGDVIKIYEYRAAGLPVLSTPIIGAGRRGIAHVAYLPPAEHGTWLREQICAAGRVPRAVSALPPDMSWKGKTEQILEMLGMEVSGGTRA